MNLYEKYLRYIKKNNFINNKYQLQAIKYLQNIIEEITNEKKRVWFSFYKKKKNITGLYMYGNIGCGKTFIMDFFYKSIIKEKKIRLNFNEFIKKIYKLLDKHKEEKNSLKKIALIIRKKYKIICFDELFIDNTTDTKILNTLIIYLMKLNTIFIITSNISLNMLYKNHPKYKNFLPVTKLIIKNYKVIHFNSNVDYRQKKEYKNKNYFYPLSIANKKIKYKFKENVSKKARYNTRIMIEKRFIQVKGIDKNKIWFDFLIICGNYRGVNDYIFLSNIYTEVYISNIPILTEKYANETKRFIFMVDQLYDKGVSIIASAEDNFYNICQNKNLRSEFKRTISRLSEMQK